MFIKKSKLRELEEKIDELSRINKVKWEKVTHCGSYSPPEFISEKYEANQADVLEALIEHLGLKMEKLPEKQIKSKIIFKRK